MKTAYTLAEVRSLQKEIRELRSKLDNRKKLTPVEVAHIRELHRNGYSQREIAEIFDINPATVSRTVRRIYH